MSSKEDTTACSFSQHAVAVRRLALSGRRHDTDVQIRLCGRSHPKLLGEWCLSLQSSLAHVNHQALAAGFEPETLVSGGAMM
jgi:hypothetical protein